MDERVKDAAVAPELTPEQKELLASLERSFQQAARGEGQPIAEILEELRQELEIERAAENAKGAKRMNEPGKSAMPAEPPVEAVAEQVELTEEQRELLRSLDRSFQQAARGDTRSVWEFLEELRLERETEP